MKAWRVNDVAGQPALVEDDIDQPSPADNEILIRVHAAGVTPTELLWYPTTHAKTGEQRRDAVPGHEFSGIVAAMGKEVQGVSMSQAVYGMNDWFANGATAEYCLALPQQVMPKPARLTHAEAASVPIGALTAWQGLLDRAKLQPGEQVLIHGGAGAVGIYAIQLARRRGARIITTASERNIPFLLQLGAQQVIDYRKEKFEKYAPQMDVIFDTVGGETLERSWPLLKPDGRMITIATGGDSADPRTKQAFFIVEANARQLSEVATLLDAGDLQPCVDGIVPFTQAAAAYTGAAGRNQGRGKVVVAVVPESSDLPV